MALANVTYTGDGSTTNFTITFAYLDRTHIAVAVDGVDTTDTSSLFQFSFVDDTHVLITAIAGGTAVGSSIPIKISRVTPTASSATTFADGAVVRASALNANTDQLLYIAQEVKDQDTSRIGLDTDNKFDAQTKVIKNVVDPTNAQDAATKNYVDTGSASQVVAATTQATNSSNSAAAALASQTASAGSAAAALASQTAAAASVVTAAGHVTSTAADAVSTAADAVSTAADRVQTGLDRTAAASSATDAQGSEDEAEAWAQKVNGEAVTGQGYSSKAWAIGGTGVSNASGGGNAKDWATETTSTADATEYSAKEYAIGAQRRGQANGGSAKDWANYTGGTVDNAGYSAKHWAEAAAASVATFDNKYFGALSADPTQDPDGSALEAGDIYYSSSAGNMRVYSGTQWDDVAVSTSGFASAGFSIAMSIAL